MQQKAFEALFDVGQNIGFQKYFNDVAPTIHTAPLPRADEQFVILNPFKPGSKNRVKENIDFIQSITIEQDCISKTLQRTWFKHFFPEDATVTMDSGGKSIHHHVRFLSPISPDQHIELVRLIKKAFPFSDHKVLTNVA